MKKFITFILGMLFHLMTAYGFFWFYLPTICNITQGAMNGFGEFITALIASVLSEAGIYAAIMKWG